MLEIKETNNIFINIFLIIARGIFKLSLIGGVIGVFHEHDLVLGVLCVVGLFWFVYSETKDGYDKDRLKIVLLGLVVTGVLGVSIEFYGVSKGYWAYHDLSNGRELPYWLPFSWALSFLFLYRLEERLIKQIPPTVFHKSLIVLLSSLIFPTFGEIVTIYLGVWTYYNLGPQFFGVPYLAILGLLVLHSLIFLGLNSYCKKKGITSTAFAS